MPNFSKFEVVLVRYPFSDLSTVKVRPAVIFRRIGRSPDYVIVALTSKTANLASGEFVLNDWQSAGLNVPSATKRGIYTVHEQLLLKVVGKLSSADSDQLELAVRTWLEIS